MRRKWYYRFALESTHERRPACRYPNLKKPRISPEISTENSNTSGNEPIEISLRTTHGRLLFRPQTADWTTTLRPGTGSLIEPLMSTSQWRHVKALLRALLVALPIVILMLWPGNLIWHTSSPQDTYQGKLLMKGTDGRWEVKSIEHLVERPKYLFISPIGSRDKGEEPRYRTAAQALAEAEGFTAIFLHESCFVRGITSRVKAGELSKLEGQRITDYDIYTLCDVVRTSGKVAFLYPNPQIPMEFREEWGKRMWTFLEGSSSPWKLNRLLPLGLRQHSRFGRTSTPDLSEVSRNTGNQNSLSDMAYAAIGLLRYRVERDRGASSDSTLFQTLAHLSLKNDSDKVIDRIISLLPRQRLSNDIPRHASNDVIWTSLCEKDSFGTLVHHITPLCEVVGVAEEDQTVFLDNCHVINIRWKDFPRMRIRGGQGGARRIVVRALVLGTAALIAIAVPLAIFSGVGHAASEHFNSSDSSRSPFGLGMELGKAIDRLGRRDHEISKHITTATLALAILCSVSAYIVAVITPFIVYRYISGTFLDCSPCLIGFEGLMPIREIEERIFGIFIGRLRYASSASHLFTDERGLDPTNRWYQEGRPFWIEGSSDSEDTMKLLKKGQRVFTLVDFGTLSVIVFAVNRPPSVALLSGREGGMLRAVLCSWSFRNDCLYKEAVVRMPSSVLANAKPTSWVKLCIQSLDEARQA
ncbi:hypothetical protein CSAL01_10116 [Colletotrichum salicis]|uniref:Uncharacterized protein n=1 Tax=Colletotrichum salicis TaxID=1209931 RepID=A0A135UAW7_9PEZI|nr:hypothetical protein CSAL01_10116 [Colletotrichum salicis]